MTTTFKKPVRADARVDRAAHAATSNPRGSSAGGLRLALAGGGTGGHIVPGLHLLAQGRGRVADVVWFLSGRAVEERVFGPARIDLEDFEIERMALTLEPEGGGAPSRAGLLVRTPRAVLRARERMKAHRTNVLLGLGGFTSLPAVLAARSLGIPVALLEINAASGEATRMLARLATRVLHAWRSTLPNAPSVRDCYVGPPLAPEYDGRAQSLADRQNALTQLSFAPDRPLLLVLGGSQGSSALNAFVRSQASAFASAGLQILHQTGPRKLAEAASPFSGYRAVEFVGNVPLALSAAALVLCRGGASSLAEIGAMRVPAIVAPYPHHRDQHQRRNALELGSGVRIVSDAELDAALGDEIVRLTSAAGETELATMRAALVDRVPTGAAARIWSELEAIA